VLTPALVGPEQLARLLRAGGGWPGSDAGVKALTGPEASALWPTRVPLRGLLEVVSKVLNNGTTTTQGDSTTAQIGGSDDL